MARRYTLWLALILWCILPRAAGAQPALAVNTLADKRATQLPAGPLYWRLETFPTRAATEAAAGPTGLVAELGGTIYLATLGPAGGGTAGGTRVAEIGPIQLPAAATYLLRASVMTGPPGSEASVHMHPGAEVYYVLHGALTVRAPAGATMASTGQSLVGPPGGTPMQPRSTGTSDLLALVLFAVDADQPFSVPATLAPPPGLPNTGAGGGQHSPTIPPALGAAALGACPLLTCGWRLRRRVAKRHG
jgi:quercetin dioxygenase-like cupin family protein